MRKSAFAPLQLPCRLPQITSLPDSWPHPVEESTASGSHGGLQGLLCGNLRSWRRPPNRWAIWSAPSARREPPKGPRRSQPKEVQGQHVTWKVRSWQHLKPNQLFQKGNSGCGLRPVQSHAWHDSKILAAWLPSPPELVPTKLQIQGSLCPCLALGGHSVGPNLCSRHARASGRTRREAQP